MDFGCCTDSYEIGYISESVSDDLRINYENRLATFYRSTTVPDSIDDCFRHLAGMGFEYSEYLKNVHCSSCTPLDFHCPLDGKFLLGTAETHFICCKKIKYRLKNVARYAKYSLDEKLRQGLKRYGFNQLVELKTLNENNIICVDVYSRLFCSKCGLQQYINDLVDVPHCVNCRVENCRKYNFSYLSGAKMFTCLKCSHCISMQCVNRCVNVCKIHYLTCMLV